MRRFTTSPSEVRRWAEAHDARPALTPGGELALALPGHGRDFERITWDEFAGFFTADHLAFVYEDDATSDFFLLGDQADCRHFAEMAVPHEYAEAP